MQSLAKVVSFFFALGSNDQHIKFWFNRAISTSQVTVCSGDTADVGRLFSLPSLGWVRPAEQQKGRVVAPQLRTHRAKCQAYMHGLVSSFNHRALFTNRIWPVQAETTQCHHEDVQVSVFFHSAWFQSLTITYEKGHRNNGTYGCI